MTQNIRSPFAARHRANAIKSTISSVVIGMAALRIKKHVSPVVLSEKALGKRPVRHEVIELLSSDDEDSFPPTGYFNDAFQPHDMYEEYIEETHTNIIDVDAIMDPPQRPAKRQRSYYSDFSFTDERAFIDLTAQSEILPQVSASYHPITPPGRTCGNILQAFGHAQDESRTENTPQATLILRAPSRSSADSYHTASGEAPPAMALKIQSDIAKPAVPAERVCPYYLDSLFGILMYRGPGYESFPIALGSIEAHQKFCDEWDEREQLNVSVRSPSSAYTNSSPNADDLPPNDVESTCLTEISQILPDIDVNFALRMIRSQVEQVEQFANTNEPLQFPAAGDVIVAILERGDYPKNKSEQTDVNEPEPEDGTGHDVQFIKGDTTNKADKAYRHDCVGLLAELFKYVPTYALDTVMKSRRSLYDAYRDIEETERKYHLLTTKPYKRKHKPRTALENKYKTKSDRASTNLRWRNIVNELQAARQSVARDEASLIRRQEQESLEAVNLLLHKESNGIVTCQCCFDDEIPLNRAITCDGEEVHWFCFSCVKSLAENQLGVMRYELICMDPSGCKAAISRQNISQAVPTKVLDKLDFFQQQSEIMAADIEGLQQCPHCEFKAICDKEDTSHAFYCANPDCGRASCLECHEKPHTSQTCEQAKMEKGLTVRHLIEEARSEAMVRTCPRCKVKIVKETGCNKIVCTNCQCVICFVCREDISAVKETGYGHFQRAGSKCPLYDKADFDRHNWDATEAEKKAIELIRADNRGIDEKALQIETGKPRLVDKTAVPAKVGTKEDKRRLEMIRNLIDQNQEIVQNYQRMIDGEQGVQPVPPMQIIPPLLPLQPQRHILPRPDLLGLAANPRVQLLPTLRSGIPKRK